MGSRVVELRACAAAGFLVALEQALGSNDAVDPMGPHAARRRSPGRKFRQDLGQVVVLLEFCAEQRAEHGGLAAEVTRADIAEQTGLAVDRVDDCNRVLESCGLLQIERRRAANGGRNLPSVYTIHEAPTSPDAWRRNGTRRAAKRYCQGRRTVLAGRRSGTRRAAETVLARRTTGTGIAEIPPPPVPSRRPLTRARVRP